MNKEMVIHIHCCHSGLIFFLNFVLITIKESEATINGIQTLFSTSDKYYHNRPQVYTDLIRIVRSLIWVMHIKFL